jgi:hypothetical protein
MLEFEKNLISFRLHYKAMAYENEEIGIDNVDHEKGMNDMLFSYCATCPVELHNGLQAAGLEYESAMHSIGVKLKNNEDVSWDEV